MATIVSRVTIAPVVDPPPGGAPAAQALAAVPAGLWWRGWRRRRLRRREMALMLDELADLLEAGLSLDAAVGIVGDSAASAAVRSSCRGLARRLRHGASLAEALGQEAVPAVVASAVRAGEESGSLVQVLRNVVDTLRRETQTRTDVLRAMAYPAFIVLLLAGVVALFLVHVLPRVEPLLGAQRPPATRLLLGLAWLITSGWPFLILGLGAGAWAARRIYRSGQRFRVPALGSLFRTLALERSFAYLGMLTRSGVDLTRAIQVTAEALGDPVVSARWQDVIGRLQRGMALAEALRAEPLISPATAQLVAIGEEAGQLDRQFDKLHRLMRASAERQLRWLVAIVGPAMLGVSAAFILLVFFGLFLPMYTNMSSLQLAR